MPNKIISMAKLNELATILDSKFKRVTVWGNEFNAFVECKGARRPSKRVEKILADLGLRIVKQTWSEGSDYSGYYYWIAE